jgi:hypothetical protein
MKKEIHKIFIFVVILLIVIPVMVYAADLTIGDNVTTSGNWSISGTSNWTTTGTWNINASSFTGDLNCTGCITDSEITGPISGSKISGTVPNATDATNATNADTVDGLHASAFASSSHNHDAVYQKKYGKVAVVAQSGGDYTDPVSAISDLSTWCGTPSSTNPCLLKIMPGVYDIGSNSLQMKDFVDIEGSGLDTKIKGNINSNISGVVKGARSEIRFLGVEQTGGGSYAIGIYNNNVSPMISHVDIIASGGSYNCAIYNTNTSSPTLTNVTATASGAESSMNVCIKNDNSSPDITNTTINASGGIISYGIDNANASSPTLKNVTATASGGSDDNYAIKSYDSSPIMTNVTATASGGTNDNYAIYGYNSSPIMKNVIATATSAVGDSVGITNINSSENMTNVIATASGGGSFNAGIRNQSCSITLTNVIATASGGTENYGLYNTGGTIRINHSVISGTTNTISSSGSNLIGNTQLDGGPVYTVSGSFKCIGVYDENYDPLDSSCL